MNHCFRLGPCNPESSYDYYPRQSYPPYAVGPLYGTSDIPMSSGTIMQGGRATGYYSTFGNQTTIIQPGKAPVYIDSYPY